MQDRADPLPVGQGPDGLLDGEAGTAVRFAALEFCGDAGGLGAQIDCLEVNSGPGEAGEVQEGVDELRHLLAGGLDLLGVASARLAEARPVFFQ